MGSETSGTAIELQQNLQSSDIAKRVFVCPMELKHIAQVCPSGAAMFFQSLDGADVYRGAGKESSLSVSGAAGSAESC